MAAIKLNNAEFYYELHGRGPALVLVGGFGADHLFWAPILEPLTQHFQILIFDNRAIGQTKDQGDEKLSADVMADDTIALIKALELKKPHIIGQSMGGTIVQSLAARYPDHISKLGILNSSLKWRKAMLCGLQALIDMRKLNLNFDIWFQQMIAWVFGEAFLQTPKQVELLKNMFLNNPFPPSVKDQERQYAVIERFNGHAGLKKITAPTLVMFGKQDILSLPDESKAIAEGIAGAKLVGLDCAHGMVAEMPRETVSALIEFFAT